MTITTIRNSCLVLFVQMQTSSRSKAVPTCNNEVEQNVVLLSRMFIHIYNSNQSVQNTCTLLYRNIKNEIWKSAISTTKYT